MKKRFAFIMMLLCAVMTCSIVTSCSDDEPEVFAPDGTLNIVGTWKAGSQKFVFRSDKTGYHKGAYWRSYNGKFRYYQISEYYIRLKFYEDPDCDYNVYMNVDEGRLEWYGGSYKKTK